MSGLSARTPSWGGEGSLFGRGGEAAGAGGAFLPVDLPLALRNIGARRSSSLGTSESTDDSDDESESSMAGSASIMW